MCTFLSCCEFLPSACVQQQNFSIWVCTRCARLKLEKKKTTFSPFSTISFPASLFSFLLLPPPLRQRYSSLLFWRGFSSSPCPLFFSLSWRELWRWTARIDGLKEQQQLCVDLFSACCSLSSRGPQRFSSHHRKLYTPRRTKERKQPFRPSAAAYLSLSLSLFSPFFCPSFPHSLNSQSVSRRWRPQPAAYYLSSLSLRLSSFCLPVHTSVSTCVSPSRLLHSVDTNLIRLSRLLCLVQNSRLYSIYGDSLFNQQMCLLSSCCPLFLLDFPKLAYQVRKQSLPSNFRLHETTTLFQLYFLGRRALKFTRVN